jgi:hypothetical protein
MAMEALLPLIWFSMRAASRVIVCPNNPPAEADYSDKDQPTHKPSNWSLGGEHRVVSVRAGSWNKCSVRKIFRYLLPWGGADRQSAIGKNVGADFASCTKVANGACIFHK